ncbi:MAG: hypothetical protein ACLFNT_10850 [Spirochaetales bacterium]
MIFPCYPAPGTVQLGIPRRRARASRRRFDGSKLSDEYNNDGQGAFPGSFTGMHVYDSDRTENWAQFEFFDYLPGEHLMDVREA